jgi:tetratricopeptide (TPR) repeat protein
VGPGTKPNDRSALDLLEREGPEACVAALADTHDPGAALVLAAAHHRLGATAPVAAALWRAAEASADRAAQASRLARTGTLWGHRGAPRPALAAFDLPLAASLAAHAVALNPALAMAHAALGEALQELGRVHEARPHLDRAAALDPTLAQRLASSRLSSGDAQGALDALAGTPDSAAVRRLRADCAVAAFLTGDAARDAAVEAILASGADDPWRGLMLLRVGAVAEARALGGVSAATVALWSRDYEVARGLLGATEGPEADRVRAALAVATDAPDAAQALQRAMAGAPDVDLGTLFAWRAAWRLQHGDPEGCVDDARSARAVSRLGHPAARALQVRGMAARAAATLHVKVWKDVADVMPPGSPAPADPASRADVDAAAAAVLRAFGGNLSPWPTVLVDGQPVPFQAVVDPRDAAANLAGSFALAAPEVLLSRLEALAHTCPASPYPWSYRGELLLWLGRYEDAARALDRAIALREDTVWAWIGRGAADLLQGDPDRALARWDEGVRACRGFEGPTLAAYRGEAWWRKGELDRARASLDAAIARHPSRLGAFVVRAIVAAAQGDPTIADTLAARLRVTLPGLAVDADAQAPTSDSAAWLTACLHLMRGNRSSSTATWVTDTGGLRVRRLGPHIAAAR